MLWKCFIVIYLARIQNNVSERIQNNVSERIQNNVSERIQNNVSERSDMSIRGMLFQWASTIKIELSVLV
jgi:hypothetical protein